MNKFRNQPTSRGTRVVTKSAREKLMDFLARRSHSELELRQKLSRDYSLKEIELAIEDARLHGWLEKPHELAERVALELSRKKKGHAFINRYLESKGLPKVAKDQSEEILKAKAVIESKLKPLSQPSREEKMERRNKIQRLLLNRGFDLETIRRTLQETGRQAT